MTSVSKALATIPNGLRKPLLAEYRSIVQNYSEHRWSPSELSGGRFCETVYTILNGYAVGAYASTPQKPRNFVQACKNLENHAHVPRSFQILIPRALPALYEVRNNRGVGHVGGDVDPNHMDATLVISICNWVMAELVRVFHNVSTEEAQTLVDGLAERRIPLVWTTQGMKRVLDPKLSLNDQALLLIGSSPDKVATSSLLQWLDYKNRTYFLKLLRKMHGERLIELSSDNAYVELLPPGSKYVAELVQRHTTRM